MTHTEVTHLPPAGRDWALPLYDPMVRLMGGGAARRRLLEQATLHRNQRILDVGCGTGSLAILIKRQVPSAAVVGIDPNTRVLDRAVRKAARASVAVQFKQGSADRLPYPDASFERVFSSFMFHHLEPHQRVLTLWEVRRVLAPGGTFHLLDFARSEYAKPGWIARRLSANLHTRDNSDRRILALLEMCGLESPAKLAGSTVLFGLLPIGFYRAQAPVRLVKDRDEAAVSSAR